MKVPRLCARSDAEHEDEREQQGANQHARPFFCPGSRHTIEVAGSAPSLIAKVYVRPTVPGAVTATTMCAPARSRAEAKNRRSDTGARSRRTLTVFVPLNGHPRPLQRTRHPCPLRCVADDQREQARVGTRELPVRRDERAQQRERSRDGVAVLVDRVAADLERPRVDLRVVVVAVRRHREAVAVAVQVLGVAAVAVLVDAVPDDVHRARMDVRVGIVAVHRRAEAVQVAVDAPLALGDDVDEVVVDDVVAGTAGDPLRDAVLGVDGVVVGLAEVLVDAAPAREGVVAGAAGEHVVRRAAEEGVVAVASGDLHRERDVVRRQPVVAPGEIDGDARRACGQVTGAAPSPVHARPPARRARRPSG